MKSWLNQLNDLLKPTAGDSASTPAANGLNHLLPGALGGLAGLLVASSSSRKLLAKYGTGALLVGGGALAGSVLWNKYRSQTSAPAAQSAPATATSPVAIDERAARLITALVYAARSDGHIDDQERRHIDEQLQHAGLEAEGQDLINRALNQPLDPQRLAAGVSGEDEALQLYFVSCAAIDIDHFMERSYLDALGEALKLSPQVRQAMEADLAAQRRQLSAE